MPNRSLAVLVLASALSLANHASANDAPANRITVEIDGIRNTKGTLRCALFDSASGFPTEPNRAVARVSAASISGGHARCVFDSVKPGAFAVSFIHDENDNQKLDRNFVGQPTEGYGASNNARGFMAPPPFDKARFTHAGVTTLRLKTEY